MRISIWDLDWYYKMDFIPNYKAQKISSYYKQQGALINFIEEEEYIKFEYDIMFIFRNKKSTPMPPSKFIDRENVWLIGEEFKYYENRFELTMEMNMVRPDYLLYNVPEGNAYANAHVLKLMHGKKLLPARQDHRNEHVKYRQKTLVVDEFLWDLEENDLEKVLQELIGYKNIAFSYPIKLKTVLKSNKILELFGQLNFMAGTLIEFRNNYGSDFESAKKIIDLAIKSKAGNRSIKIKPIPIKAVIYDHWKDRSKGIVDLKRILKIIDYAKTKRIQVAVKTPLKRFATPFWYYFDSIQIWTEGYFKQSYIESMVATRIVRTREEWYEPLNDSVKWSTPRIYFLVHLLNTYPEIMFKYGIRRMGDEVLDTSLINRAELKKIALQTDKIEKEFSKEVEI